LVNYLADFFAKFVHSNRQLFDHLCQVDLHSGSCIWVIFSTIYFSIHGRNWKSSCFGLKLQSLAQAQRDAIQTLLRCWAACLGFHGWGFLMFERVEFEPGPFIVGESTAANEAMLPPHQGWLLGARFFFLCFLFFSPLCWVGGVRVDSIQVFIDWDNFHQLLCKANLFTLFLMYILFFSWKVWFLFQKLIPAGQHLHAYLSLCPTLSCLHGTFRHYLLIDFVFVFKKYF